MEFNLQTQAQARNAREERLNALTHGCGLLLSLVASFVLVSSVAMRGDIWLVLGCAAYAATLMAVYAASTLSHSVQHPRLRLIFRAWDQGLIYLLIAGTYTPFAIAYLRSGWWWLLIVAMWVLALAGFASKVIKRHRVETVSTVTYIVLSWLPLLGIRPLLAQVPPDAVFWAITGGACYLLGVLFLIFDTKATYLHAVWHVLVIAGSAFQFVSIYQCTAV